MLDPEGYKKSIWGKNGSYKKCKIKGRNFLLHILVASLFVPGRTDEKNQVNHIDENIENNKASNLEWLSQSENISHSIYRQFKEVEQIDIKTKQVLNIFKSRADAAEAMSGKRNSSPICKATKKPLKTTAYGYYWKDVSEK